MMVDSTRVAAGLARVRSLVVRYAKPERYFYLFVSAYAASVDQRLKDVV